ncbi:MAG: hypothetical protein NTW74_12340 [Acidobacteria bacterium]|nr:hypothetical protein [Acidobacteriota bacterium]
MAKHDEIRLQVWTEHFLGTRTKGETFIDLLQRLDGGRWVPDKWGHYEPVRRAYEASAKEAILTALTESRGGRIANNINFVKARPRASFSLNVWRSRVADMNSIYADFDAKAFLSADGSTRIGSIVEELVKWSGAVFASARHTRQEHWRVAQKTPRERLQEMDWLTFLGKPYVELFGGTERVLKAPCHSVKELSGGFVLMASTRPDGPEMTDSNATLLRLEEFLGADAFAGRGYPEVPCRVPIFDLSDTVKLPLIETNSHE